MKKILSLLGTLVVASSTTSGTLAVVQSQGAQVPQLPGQPQKISLDTVLTKLQLGILENGNNQEILTLAKFNNPNLNVNEVEIIKINNQLALITPLKESQVYEQILIGVQVTFSVKEKEKLGDVINQINLGEIADQSPENILIGLKKANPNLNEEDVNVRLNTITEQSAVIQAKPNGRYKNEVVIYYTLAAKKLSKDLVQPSLGFLPNNDEKTIFNALINVNPNLITTEFTLQNITLSSSLVVVNENSTVYEQEEILINFTTSSNSLKNDLTTTNLGEIRSNSITEITKALSAQTKVQINETQIFDVTGFSFKIQARTNSHYYRVEDPILVSFVLPQKIDIQEKVGDFKWVNYRSKEEIIKKIKSLIGAGSGNENKIEYERDFIIEGLGDSKDKMEDDTLLIVKAVRDSEYLTGEFTCDIIPVLDLTRWSQNNIAAVKDDTTIITGLVEKIKTYLTEQNIREDVDQVVKTLKIASTSSKYTYKHLSYYYYRNIDFEMQGSSIFKNKISWTNISAPIYETGDINITVDTTPMISFVDSTGDGNYPDNPPNKTPYVNKNHNPTRAYWEVTDAIEFGSIPYKEFTLSQTIDDFFKLYKIEFNYKYSINAWVNNSYGWKNSDGKYTSLISKTRIFESKTDTGTARQNSTKKEYDATGFSFYDGDFGDAYTAYKGAGAIQVYMLISSDEILIKGVAGSWFDWKNSSKYHHAGFARLRAESIKIRKK